MYLSYLYNKEKIKVCIMPKCYNNSEAHPEKIYLYIETAKRWCWSKIFEVKHYFPPHTFVCQDHFDLENDLENYTEMKNMNWEGIKPKFKFGVVPKPVEVKNKENPKTSVMKPEEENRRATKTTK